MSSRDAWIFRRGLLWVSELDARKVASVTAYIPVQFSQVTGESVTHLLTAVRQMDPIAPDAIAQRLEQGRQCFAAWADGQVAAYGWLTCGPEWVGEFERTLQVEHGEAYIWDCATIPKYRRLHLFGALLNHIVNHLQQSGLQRLWIIGLARPSEFACGMFAAGFQPVMTLTYVRLFGHRGLLVDPHPGASPSQAAAARRLLGGEKERIVGRWMIGQSGDLKPPDTHFDR
jgi:GNAT superfamily N-acetyltransferase